MMAVIVTDTRKVIANVITTANPVDNPVSDTTSSIKLLHAIYF